MTFLNNKIILSSEHYQLGGFSEIKHTFHLSAYFFAILQSNQDWKECVILQAETYDSIVAVLRAYELAEKAADQRVQEWQEQIKEGNHFKRGSNVSRQAEPIFRLFI